MDFIKNNREMVVLTVIIIGLFAMATAIGYDFRGGNPWLF